MDDWDGEFPTSSNLTTLGKASDKYTTTTLMEKSAISSDGHPLPGEEHTHDCQTVDPSVVETLPESSQIQPPQQPQHRGVSLPHHPNDHNTQLPSKNTFLPKNDDNDAGASSKIEGFIMTSGIQEEEEQQPMNSSCTPPSFPNASLDNSDTIDTDQERRIRPPLPPPRLLPPHRDVPSSSPSMILHSLSPSRNNNESNDKVGQKEVRRKNRRRLYRLLKNPKVIPSFLRLIEDEEEPSSSNCNNNSHNETTARNISSDDDNEDFLLEPPMVVIDVDEYLGLKKRKFPDPIESVFSSSGNNSMYIPTTVVSSSSSTATVSPRQRKQQQPNSSARLILPNVTTSLTNTLSSLPPQPNTTGGLVGPTTITKSSMLNRSNNPADEGWYEGILPMVQLPEDDIYLTDIQQWTRQNLEYFSATDHDVLMTQSGRRTPTVRGKVGIRCIHCAKVVLDRIRQQQQQQQQQQHDGGIGGKTTTTPSRISWPAGSVSYPVNFAGLYSGAIQKPQLHFENCPNMPPNSRLSELLTRSRANQLGTATPAALGSLSSSSRSGIAAGGSGTTVTTSVGTKRKRMKEGMSALLYWTIACHRIGLIEVEGNGLRFGRDLSLEPLPFESTRTTVETEHPELMPKQQQQQSGFGLANTKSSDRGGSPAPDRIQSRVSSTTEGEPTLLALNLPQEVVAVIDEARAEEDDHANLLARQEDQYGLSYFMFLTVKQAALCHASNQDFATRGKKTKLMRVGFTGFCCRHCKQHYPSNDSGGTATIGAVDVPTFQNSCRSFASSHENLASAMSNSFVLHLLKCVYTPRSIKQALQTLKRTHPRQMQQLPYGSQSRVFMLMWERARAADCMTEPLNDAIRASIANNNDDTHDDSGGAISDVEDVPEADDDEEFVPDNEGSPRSETEAYAPMVPQRVVSSATSTSGPGRRSKSKIDSSPGLAPISRVLVVDDEETKQLLNNVEMNWETTENDGLILPEDKYLISDYVFLCMRQLKVAHPTPADFKGNRRNNVLSKMAGICCVHCAKNESHQYIKPSGRSFPSAPDNLASALNVSSRSVSAQESQHFGI
jgi:hypothetical protein